MASVTHFAIPADDVERARAFYERVFGWRFTTFRDEPDFYQVLGAGLEGAIEKRRHPAAEGGANAFICTIGVESVGETERLIREQGGEITLLQFTIAGVGTLIQFRDTEGNIVGAMEYAQR